MTSASASTGHPDRQNRKLTQAPCEADSVNATHSGRFDTILCGFTPGDCQPRAESDIASGMPNHPNPKLRPFSSVIS